MRTVRKRRRLLVFGVVRRDSVRAGFLFHFPPFIFLFPFPFLSFFSPVLLPPTPLSARSSLLSLSLFSPLPPYHFSLRSGLRFVGVRARRRCCRSTYFPSTRTLPSSLHLPTMCSTTWPLLPLWTPFRTYLCQLTISSDSPSLSRTFSILFM